MKTTRVTDKGQVKLPASVRDELAMDTGGVVRVEAVDGRAVVRRIDEWAGLAGTVVVPDSLVHQSLSELREAGMMLWAAEAVGARLFAPGPGRGGVR